MSVLTRNKCYTQKAISQRELNAGGKESVIRFMEPEKGSVALWD